MRPRTINFVYDYLGESVRLVLFYLLAPSNAFNEIEMAFLRLKSMLRKIRERTVNGLWDLIGRLFDIFQPDECANYFISLVSDLE